MKIAIIIDAYGDTESTATIETTADAVRFYQEHGIDFAKVTVEPNPDGNLSNFVYRRPASPNDFVLRRSIL